jgi:hypothetical protein
VGQVDTEGEAKTTREIGRGVAIGTTAHAHLEVMIESKTSGMSGRRRVGKGVERGRRWGGDIDMFLLLARCRLVRVGGGIPWSSRGGRSDALWLRNAVFFLLLSLSFALAFHFGLGGTVLLVNTQVLQGLGR